MDQCHFQATEQDGTHTHPVAQQQIEYILQDGETATHGGTANHTVNKEGDMFLPRQIKQRDGLHSLFKNRIDIIRHTLRQEQPRHLEKAEASQSSQHTAQHKRQQPLHADQREIVQEINYGNVEDNGKQCGDELHQRSFSETIISLLWRPPGKPSGANRWPKPTESVVLR